MSVPDKEVLDKLLALMIEKEKRDAARPPNKTRRWQQIGWYFEGSCRSFNRQQNCKHSKGGRVVWSGMSADSSVHRHMFIDSSEKIWCAYCPFEAWSNNPKFSFKWQYALKLWGRSMEHASSSERIVPEFKGPEAGRGEFRYKDLRRDESENGTLQLKDNEGPIKGQQASVLDWRKP
jgi:hypothetical protein